MQKLNSSSKRFDAAIEDLVVNLLHEAWAHPDLRAVFDLDLADADQVYRVLRRALIDEIEAKVQRTPYWAVQILFDAERGKPFQHRLPDPDDKYEGASKLGEPD